MVENSCFKAYDIRGSVPSELNRDFAFRLGKACRSTFGADKVVIGRDARLSSPMLEEGLANGLTSVGIHVFSLGLCGTEEIYHAAASNDYDLGIMITGSHNPGDQNGFKLVLRGAFPVSSQNGLDKLQVAVEKDYEMPDKSRGGKLCQINLQQQYVDWLLNYCAIDKRGKSLRVVINAGNGCAGPMLDKLGRVLPFEFIPLHYEPDGNFPNGVPNPLLPERRADTTRAVIESKADFGVAFDGDFDRCFFFDEDGNFIEGYYLVGVIAAAMLAKEPGGKIIHDPRLYWNTREIVLNAGGIPIMAKTGHAFMKEKMRNEKALYGGEMSSHHYFRDFSYCDSGMLTMLFMLRYLQKTSRTLGEIVANAIREYPCSGEINFNVGEASQAMEAIRRKFGSESVKQDCLDGLNMEFQDWRFNLRPSNTESLLRLNVESRGNRDLMRAKAEELSILLKNF